MSENGLFANWLKRRRKSLDLTREELAQRAHCSASAVRRLEAGDLRPGKQLAESLAAVLDIPPEQHEAFIRFARGDSEQFSVLSDQRSVASSTAISNLPSPREASSLPAPLTSLVGRTKEVAIACDLLREPGVRLLTLTGPPGIGKTRLSIAAANDLIASDPHLFPDGAHFVPLSPIGEPDMVVAAIAQALDVRESGSRNILDSLREFLRPKRLLLVLDNFEQVVAAAPLITDLLTIAPGVKALVTSREVLHLYGEHEYPVPALALPDVQRLPTTLARSFYAQYSSIQLFRDRARAARADFALTPDNLADVARICAWLDGLPLAIEMAAAQVKWLPTDQLLDQLSHRLTVLTGGPRDLSPRQQSLSGAIDWSYNLLNPDEKRLFDVLGIFVGGCDEEAILDVWQCSEPKYQISTPHKNGGQAVKSQIRNLVDKSLLHLELAGQGQPRYVMLETIRDYARERLQARGEFECVRQTHAEYYSRLALAARPSLVSGGEQAAWLNRLEAEHNNLRAALAWAAEDRTRAEFMLTLAEAMYHFWSVRGYLSEGRRWLEKALALLDAPTELRARVLNCAGRLAQMQGDYGIARAFHEQALAIQDRTDDDPGLCRSLENLAILSGSQGDYARAGELFEQSLAVRRKIGDRSALMPPLNNLAVVHRRLGNYARADELYHETAALARETNSLKSLSHALHGLGEVRMMQNDYAAALAFFREGLTIRHQLGNRPELTNSLGSIAMALYHLGDGRTAAQLIGASEKLRQELGIAVQPSNRAEIEENIASVRERLGATVFEKAWAEGQTMSLDEAVVLAQVAG